MEVKKTSHSAGDPLTIDLLRVLSEYRRVLVLSAVVATGIAFVLGGVYFFWLQPSDWTATVGFRPTFSGVERGRYPNDLPFSAADITSASVLDRLFDASNIESLCSREQFRKAFFVEQQSIELLALDTEYSSRIVDARLTAVDRQRMLTEYGVKRAAAPVQYRLVFAPSGDCQQLPPDTVSKLLDGVLSTWVYEAEATRGVLRLRARVLTPSVFDTSSAATETLFVRAWLTRSALNRSLASVREVQALPGSDVIRYGDQKVSFADIEARLEDLIHVRYEPAMTRYGSAFGADAVATVEESLATAATALRAAEARFASYMTAMREHSNVRTSTAAGPISPPPTTQKQADSSVTIQIDSAFIDRIVEVSASSTKFRQEMTRGMVETAMVVAEARADTEYHQRLLGAFRRAGGRRMSASEMEKQLDQILFEGKGVMRQFNVLYDEFSRVALKPATMMYRIEQPAHVEIVRSFSLREYVLFVLGVFLMSLVAALVASIVHDHFVRSVRPVTSAIHADSRS